jgi:hypothetical protein
MWLTMGILRHFRAFSTPEQNPALEVLFTSAHFAGNANLSAAEIVKTLKKIVVMEVPK